MPLLADAIGLGDPGRERSVEVLGARDPEVVDVIAPGDGVHAEETRMSMHRGKDEVTPKAALLHRDGHERHADVECDPGFLR